jgi:hypothetical protein
MTNARKQAKSLLQAIPYEEARDYAFAQLEANASRPEQAMFWREVVAELLAMK